MTLEGEARRNFARQLTAVANAGVKQVLDAYSTKDDLRAAGHRLGVTGPPGAGKSTLIGNLAVKRLEAFPQDAHLAVIAIDPTSPLSGGSILGDRIRMEAAAELERIFVRSVPSGTTGDGLADNIADILALADQHGFCETILETVGVGQAEYALRLLVDTMVLIVPPHSGDAVQAIKAGILELPDIYVVNKADLDGARQAASSMKWLAGRRMREQWQPRLVMTSNQDPASLDELHEAIEAHRSWLKGNSNLDSVRHKRRRYHVASLIARRVKELDVGQATSATLSDDYAAWINRLRADLSYS